METRQPTEATALKQATEQTDLPEPNPLAQSGGRFQSDPFWEEMLASIRQHRREMDAEW